METDNTCLVVEFGREEDGRWIAEAVDIPGVLAYGKTRDEALAAVQELAAQALTKRDHNPRNNDQ